MKIIRARKYEKTILVYEKKIVNLFNVKFYFSTL